jgi:hypothetical protein
VRASSHKGDGVQQEEEEEEEEGDSCASASNKVTFVSAVHVFGSGYAHHLPPDCPPSQLSAHHLNFQNLPPIPLNLILRMSPRPRHLLDRILRLMHFRRPKDIHSALLIHLSAEWLKILPCAASAPSTYCWKIVTVGFLKPI